MSGSTSLSPIDRPSPSPSGSPSPNKSAKDKSATADPTVICRCEELTDRDIIDAWEAGYRTPEEIKRRLRLGMGPCQGRTCTPLLLTLAARLAGRPIAEIVPPQGRPPLKPTPLAMFGALSEDAADDADDSEGRPHQ